HAPALPSFPTRRSSDLSLPPPSGIGAHGACDGFLKYRVTVTWQPAATAADGYVVFRRALPRGSWTRAALITDPRATSFVDRGLRSEEHTSELQSLRHLV